MSVSANQLICRQEGHKQSIPVAASTHIYQATLTFLAGGYADDDTNSGANRFAGVAISEVDNSAGAAGDLEVEVWRSGVFEMQGSGFAQTDVGKDVFATDNFTVTTQGSASGVIVGKVERYLSSTKIMVRLTVDQQGDVLYAPVAASTAVSNTITETAFDKSITIPANKLRVGDVIRARLQVIASNTNSTDTLTLKLYLGSTQIVTTGAVDVATGDIGYIDVDIVIRTIGASGTFVAAGVQALGVPGTVTAKPFLLGSTALDTTADLVLALKATWSVASSSDSARLDIMDVQILRKQAA